MRRNDYVDPFYNDVLPLAIIVMAIVAIWTIYLLS